MDSTNLDHSEDHGNEHHRLGPSSQLSTIFFRGLEKKGGQHFLGPFTVDVNSVRFNETTSSTADATLSGARDKGSLSGVKDKISLSGTGDREPLSGTTDRESVSGTRDREPLSDTRNREPISGTRDRESLSGMKEPDKKNLLPGLKLRSEVVDHKEKTLPWNKGEKNIPIFSVKEKDIIHTKEEFLTIKSKMENQNLNKTEETSSRKSKEYKHDILKEASSSVEDPLMGEDQGIMVLEANEAPTITAITHRSITGNLSCLISVFQWCMNFCVSNIPIILKKVFSTIESYFMCQLGHSNLTPVS